MAMKILKTGPLKHRSRAKLPTPKAADKLNRCAVLDQLARSVDKLTALMSAAAKLARATLVLLLWIHLMMTLA